MQTYPLLLLLHLVGVVVWVGGMFFAYLCLRPAAVAVLEAPARLRLWRAVFGRFFPWVWGAITLIVGSGLMLLMAMPMKPPHVHWMMAVALLMVAIYAYVFSMPYGGLKRGVAAEDWPAAGAALNRIRQCVAVNLCLGLLTLGIATVGRYFA